MRATAVAVAAVLVAAGCSSSGRSDVAVTAAPSSAATGPTSVSTAPVAASVAATTTTTLPAGDSRTPGGPARRRRAHDPGSLGVARCHRRRGTAPAAGLPPARRQPVVGDGRHAPPSPPSCATPSMAPSPPPPSARRVAEQAAATSTAPVPRPPRRPCPRRDRRRCRRGPSAPRSRRPSSSPTTARPRPPPACPGTTWRPSTSSRPAWAASSACRRRAPRARCSSCRPRGPPAAKATCGTTTTPSWAPPPTSPSNGVPDDMANAVWRYNPNEVYLEMVTRYADRHGGRRAGLPRLPRVGGLLRQRRRRRAAARGLHRGRARSTPPPTSPPIPPTAWPRLPVAACDANTPQRSAPVAVDVGVARPRIRGAGTAGWPLRATAGT